MGRKISEETKEQISRLYGQGLSLTEIVRQTNVSFSSVYILTKAKERGFNSYTEYANFLATQKTNPKTDTPFISRAERRKYLLMQKGFNSYTEYDDDLAKRTTDFETGSPFNSLRARREHFARQKGYKSYNEYAKYLTTRRQQKEENKKLSQFIRKKLTELAQTQKWLAEQLEVSKEAVSTYFHGKAMPRKNVKARLLEILNHDGKTLDSSMDSS